MIPFFTKDGKQPKFLPDEAELKETGINLFDTMLECETQSKLRSQVNNLEYRVAKLEKILAKKIKKFERKEGK